MTVTIINGPNLNMLGRRDPAIYGAESLEQTIADIRQNFPQLEVISLQSNHEGEIIDMLQQEGSRKDSIGVVLNPGAYAHYSLAIADAVADMPLPVVEVHISNIFAREGFRAVSVTARNAAALISGCGRHGYSLAVMHLLSLLDRQNKPA